MWSKPPGLQGWHLCQPASYPLAASKSSLPHVFFLIWNNFDMSRRGLCSSRKIGEPECGADSQSAASTLVWTPVPQRSCEIQARRNLNGAGRPDILQSMKATGPANGFHPIFHLDGRADLEEFQRAAKARERGEPIDSVKGAFTEGGPIYPGSGFHKEPHPQIAVVNPACIQAVFRFSPTFLAAHPSP